MGAPRVIDAVQIWAWVSSAFMLPEVMDEKMIDTPDGPVTWAEWKKKNPVQIPSRRTKGKKLPNKVKQRTDEPD